MSNENRELADSAARPVTVSCPICGRQVRWDEPPRGPFCSERCRLIDLGAWAEGRYAIPGPSLPEEPSEPDLGGDGSPSV